MQHHDDALGERLLALVDAHPQTTIHPRSRPYRAYDGVLWTTTHSHVLGRVVQDDSGGWEVRAILRRPGQTPGPRVTRSPSWDRIDQALTEVIADLEAL